MDVRIACFASAAMVLPLLTSPVSRAEEASQKSYIARLQSEDPNYFVYASPIDNGELDGDDPHVEFYLSIQYPFHLWENARLWQPDHLVAVYNGLYDFYMIPGKRYDSAPVLSRRQNPGAALEWDAGSGGRVRLGYFHESNGQTIDADDGAAAYARELLQGGREYALSQISRGWDYADVRYRQTGGERWNCASSSIAKGWAAPLRKTKSSGIPRTEPASRTTMACA